VCFGLPPARLHRRRDTPGGSFGQAVPSWIAGSSRAGYAREASGIGFGHSVILGSQASLRARGSINREPARPKDMALEVAQAGERQSLPVRQPFSQSSLFSCFAAVVWRDGALGNCPVFLGRSVPGCARFAFGLGVRLALAMFLLSLRSRRTAGSAGPT
jgi:hypothetical protein